MSWSRSVYSSMVSEVAWSDDSGQPELTVTFVKGQQGVYEGVSEEEAIALSKAASVGQYLNNSIKPFFRYRKLR